MKKYQVFISSTFLDLKEERQRVMNAILKANCIPAGMEAFVAANEDQFSVIKKVIDLCDYYILILNNRYGSINATTGKSYTEMEYDYAVSLNIPILVFASTNIAPSKEDEIAHSKFLVFREKVMKGRMASTWDSPSDLSVDVAIALNNAIKDYPRPGWIRGNINSTEVNDDEIDIKPLEEFVTLNFSERLYVLITDRKISHASWKLTIGAFFKLIGPELYSDIPEYELIEKAGAIVGLYNIEPASYNVVKSKLTAYDLIVFSTQKVGKEIHTFVCLTDKGKKVLDYIVKNNLFNPTTEANIE